MFGPSAAPVMSSGTYRRPRESLAVFDPFTRSGLPPDDSLAKLPPLPDTPNNQSTTDYTAQGVVTVFFNRTSHAGRSRAASQDRLVDVDGWAVPGTVTRSITRSSDSLQSLESPAKYPVMSTRQSASNVPRHRTSPVRHSPPKANSNKASPSRPSSLHVSPTKPDQSALLPTLRSSPVRSSARPGTQNQSFPSDTSFQLPINMSDTSLLRDCSFGEAPSSNGDNSIDLMPNGLRPALPIPSELGYNRRTSEEGSITLTRTLPPVVQTNQQSTALKPSKKMQNLYESTLLPSSPVKLEHMLLNSDSLATMAPPWTRTDSTARSRTSPFAPSCRPSTTHSSRASPRHTSNATPQTSRRLPSPSPSTSQKTKRTFPASSSGSSLASVGEEQGHGQNADVSTLLPSSPDKLQHLLHDQEMIIREAPLDEASFKSLPRRSPAKIDDSTPSSSRTVKKSVTDEGDMTLDVRDLMAKMTKPKRASGTEESFADLLHGDDPLEGVDMSMMGPDETFHLESLRPRHRATVRSVMPSANSARSLRSALSTTSDTSRRRSRSLSELSQPNDLFSDPFRHETPTLSPTKPPNAATHTRQLCNSRPAVSAIATPMIRPRSSILPTTTAISKRISLSVGALPDASSASHRKIEVNRARPDHSRASSITKAPTVASLRSTFDSLPHDNPPGVSNKSIKAPPSARPGSTQHRCLNPKSRSGSTSMIAPLPTAAKAPLLPSSRNPAVTGGSVRSAVTTAASASLLEQPRPTGRPAFSRPHGLPQPGTGPTARSAPVVTSTRTFGASADATTNRSAKPVATVVAGRTKLSAGPIFSPSKLEATGSIKSRALSTPATAAARQAIQPPSRAARPPIELLKKQSMLPTTCSTSALPRPRTGSSLIARPAGSRLPAVSGKTSNPPTGGLASLRERLDKLQARTGR